MDIDPKGGIMKIDPNELPSVHVFLNIVRIFFETEQSDPRWKEIYQDAKGANECAIAMLSRPEPGVEPCKDGIKRIIADQYGLRKEV
jgi:hypothetical protein